MIFSKVCINPDKGFDITDKGTLRPRELGYYVYTIQELEDLGK